MKKFLRYTGLTLLVLGVFGFLSFVAFVYNVFEGSISEIRTGIPRTVDFYVGKRQLSGDFDEFPVPKFWTRLESGPDYAQLSRSRLFAYAEKEAGLRKALEEVRKTQKQLSDIPVVNVRILGDVLGKDAAVAGRLRGSGQTPIWASYLQVSWKICAFHNLLGYSSMREQMASNGLKVTQDEKLFRLEPSGAAPVWMTRVLDLLIVGNDRDFVEESRGLAAGERETEDSLQVSPDYIELVRNRLQGFGERHGVTANAAEFKLNLTQIAAQNPAFAAWPGEGAELSQELKLLGSFVRTKAMRALWGGLEFQDQILSALLTIDMNRNELTKAQEGFYDADTADIDSWIRPKLQCIPSTAAAFVFLRVPVQLFLEEFVASLEKDARDLIDEGLRRAGQRGGVRGLIDNFARGLQPYVLVIVRNNDYPRYDVEFEVKIPSPAPAVAWVVEVKPRERERVQQVLELLRKDHRQFGFQSCFNLKAGPGGAVQIDEWPSTYIPATGQIAILDGGPQLANMLMLSNSGKLLRECISAYFGQAGARSIASSDKLYQTLQRYPRPSELSGFAWVNGKGLRELAQRYLDFALRAAQSNDPDPNWAIVNRPKIEQEIFRQEFRRKASSKFELQGKDREEFENRVKEMLRLRWQQGGQGRGQKAIAGFQDLQRYLQFLEAAYVVLRNDPQKIEAELRAFLNY